MSGGFWQGSKFAAFILTHGRARRMYTDKMLRHRGYTGDIYYVVDDEDRDLPAYRKKYGDAVLVFSKSAVDVDLADNLPDKRSVVFARNAVYDLAEGLGLQYFLCLEDDYTDFWWFLDSRGFQRHLRIRNLDNVFRAVLDFYVSLPERVKVVALAQGGDWGGGFLRKDKTVQLLCKAMNVLFCSPSRRVRWRGRLNDDVNTYVMSWLQGDMMFTVNVVGVKHMPPQGTAGGMSGLYDRYGMYAKSFYSLLYAPGAVQVSILPSHHQRIHHHVFWDAVVPKIVRES